MNSLEWCRSKVLELSSQGHNQPEIARILQISPPTVNRDISYLEYRLDGTCKNDPRQTARRISKLYDWNKSSVKDCNHYRSNIIEIFQESGEFCLLRWQEKTYPNL